MTPKLKVTKWILKTPCNQNKARSRSSETTGSRAHTISMPRRQARRHCPPQPSRFRPRDRFRSGTAALAVRDVPFGIAPNQITALIGPSGCGKSTLLRCFNRMNDLIPGARWRARSASRAGSLRPDIDPVQAPPAHRHGLPEAEPVPQERSTRTSPAGRGSTACKGDMDELVESALRRAALWDEVKNRLERARASASPAASSSGSASPARSPSSPRSS